ncbi:MAG: hypothetical protein M1826_002578 [Phylliscum demangeonii]|nr:MAG: hypothetical protein M1826_002578 [Phylliscum demangeonii]
MDPPDAIPQPGPAHLPANAGPDEWLEQARQCRYLPEADMKQLCEIVKECLMEESNIQPVRTPVTVCGDIHGQFYDLLELFRVAGGMPNASHTEAPTVPTRVITSADLEPPLPKPAAERPWRRKIIRGRGDEDDATEDGRPGEETTSTLEDVSELDDDDDDHGPEDADAQRQATDESARGAGNYIFLGDFVDRGYFSLETFTLLMCLKARYPDRVTLVRGNHESRQITQVYGFYEECQSKYGNASVWKSCCQVFDFLALAAIVDGKVLCVHGGLSPEIRTLDQIRVVARAQEIPHEGAFCDLVWSDPEDIETWAVSPRGAGWLFGDKVATEFNHVNDLQLIARAHQLVNEGFKVSHPPSSGAASANGRGWQYHFKDRDVVTVWSAPNYCYRCGNVASIMKIGEALDVRFSIFGAVPDEQRAVPTAGGRGSHYFL